MAIFYYIIYAIIFIPLSLLPFRIRYWVSDLLYVVLFRVVKYRRKVVELNIHNAFPEKSASEKAKIVKKFYKHLADLIMESISMFTVSKKSLYESISFEENEDLNKHFKENQSVIMCSAHFNNWEYIALASTHYFSHTPIGIYLPLKNKFFNEKMKKSRGKFGLTMVPTHTISQYLARNKAELKITLFGFDQSPGDPNKSYWMDFLNQDTAVIFGPEKISSHYNYPVYYGHLDKVSRGKYHLRLKLITDQPSDTKYGFITESLAHTLEEDIKQHPEYWLWSHRRWKLRRPEKQKNTATFSTP